MGRENFIAFSSLNAIKLLIIWGCPSIPIPINIQKEIIYCGFKSAFEGSKRLLSKLDVAVLNKLLIPPPNLASWKTK